MWHDARSPPCTRILDQQWCERNNFYCSKNIGTHVCLYFSPQISAYFYLPSNHLIISLLGNLWAVRNGLSALHLSMHYRKELEKCWLRLYFQLIFFGAYLSNPSKSNWNNSFWWCEGSIRWISKLKDNHDKLCYI